MVFRIYNLLFPVVFLLMLPGYLRRMVRRGNYRRHFGQRFGIFSREQRAALAVGPPRIWVQAVSVGEMLVALKLIEAMRRRRPELMIILSTTTTTGFQLAQERVSVEVQVIYTPIDLHFAVRRTFDLLRPDAVVIVDGGLWPNQLLEARRRGIPVTLANARLSPRSERRFRRFAFLARSMFGLLDRVCVPEGADVARWQTLGVAPERIAVTGSIKYDDSLAGGDSENFANRSGDPALRTVLRSLGVKDDAPVLFGGSTHAGEERLLAEVFLELRARFPALLLIIAPRHVERSGEILRELAPLGIRTVLRTDTPDAYSQPEPPDLFLLDTTGELRAWYSLATLVFIGKSMTATGGQNPAEAIAAGKAILFGPHMENFASLAAQLLASGAAIQVNSGAELREQAPVLLTGNGFRERMVGRARDLLLTHRGAAGRTAELLLP